MREEYTVHRDLPQELAMSDDAEKTLEELERLEKGYRPEREGEVRGGYQPETSEAGNPPKGGSGAQETEDKK